MAQLENDHEQYRSKAVVPKLLKVGDNIVMLLAVIWCYADDELKLIKGKLEITGKKVRKPNDVIPPWTDVIKQIAIWMTDADGNNAIHRFNRSGVTLSEDPEYADNPVMLSSSQYTVVHHKGKNYVVETVNGQTVRVENKRKTQSCKEAIEEFLLVLADGVEDLGFDDLTDKAIATKKQFIVTMKPETWPDPDTGVISVQLNVDKHGFKRIGQEAVVPGRSDKGIES